MDTLQLAGLAVGGVVVLLVLVKALRSDWQTVGKYIGVFLLCGTSFHGVLDLLRVTGILPNTGTAEVTTTTTMRR